MSSLTDEMWTYKANPDFNDPWESVIEQSTEDTKMRALSLELIKLQGQMLEETKKRIDEEVIRTDNPAVKDAWDKYQTVLRLASNVK